MSANLKKRQRPDETQSHLPPQQPPLKNIKTANGGRTAAVSAKGTAATSTTATTTTTTTTTTAAPKYPAVSKREFASLRFFFEGVSSKVKAEFESDVLRLQAKISFIFKRETISHLVVGDEVLRAFAVRTNKTTAMANNRSAIQSNAYDKTISFAKQWGLKIWTASEFRYHTSRLLGKPSATAPTAAGASASAASKNNTLKALLEKEKKLSHSTNRGQDPKAALRGFHELHGHYILVEDIHQIYKTISWREYNGSPADPNFVATPNSAVMGAWPQMYLDGKENGKFLGNAFMPPDDEDEEEGENANGQNECKEGDLQGKKSHTTLSKKTKSAARTEDHEDSGSEDEEDSAGDSQPTDNAGVGENCENIDNMDQDGVEEDEFEEDDDTVMGSGYQATINSHASGLNNTTSMRPILEPTNPSKNVEGLMKRVLTHNHANKEITLLGKSIEVEAVTVPEPVQKAPPKKKKRRSGPKGKDFYFRAGYCENCSEKYDSFIEHVKSERHQLWASDKNNFGIVDKFIATVTRKRVPRAKVVPIIIPPQEPPASKEHIRSGELNETEGGIQSGNGDEHPVSTVMKTPDPKTTAKRRRSSLFPPPPPPVVVENPPPPSPPKCLNQHLQLESQRVCQKIDGIVPQSPQNANVLEMETEPLAESADGLNRENAMNQHRIEALSPSRLPPPPIHQQPPLQYESVANENHFPLHDNPHDLLVANLDCNDVQSEVWDASILEKKPPQLPNSILPPSTTSIHGNSQSADATPNSTIARRAAATTSRMTTSAALTNHKSSRRLTPITVYTREPSHRIATTIKKATARKVLFKEGGGDVGGGGGGGGSINAESAPSMVNCTDGTASKCASVADSLIVRQEVGDIGEHEKRDGGGGLEPGGNAEIYGDRIERTKERGRDMIVVLRHEFEWEVHQQILRLREEAGEDDEERSVGNGRRRSYGGVGVSAAGGVGCGKKTHRSEVVHDELGQEEAMLIFQRLGADVVRCNEMGSVIDDKENLIVEDSQDEGAESVEKCGAFHEYDQENSGHQSPFIGVGEVKTPANRGTAFGRRRATLGIVGRVNLENVRATRSTRK